MKSAFMNEKCLFSRFPTQNQLHATSYENANQTAARYGPSVPGYAQQQQSQQQHNPPEMSRSYNAHTSYRQHQYGLAAPGVSSGATSPGRR